MGDTKQVKVDNWGTFFLQRLKHFFNRTDYCDLTLQFQDNAQLKVHRLVLNACTEYFELLERTCEMYEDCLIMPDDLQADVVVPIVNFMYTGQLEYKFDLLDRLYQTAQIMNMSVLTKLLDAHRSQPQPQPPPKPAPKKYRQTNSYSRTRAVPSTSQQKVYIPSPKQSITPKVVSRYGSKAMNQMKQAKQRREMVARPTRYELPEELDKDFLFENAFTDISYESRPLMIHPLKEDKQELIPYEPSGSKKFEDLRRIMKRPSTSTADMVEFKRLKTNQNNTIFEGDDYTQSDDGQDIFDNQGDQPVQEKESFNRIYDHTIDAHGAKVTIETKSSDSSTIDHAKIISEVLKKYPHLVKNNKNIKLKIVNTPTKPPNKPLRKTQVKPTSSPDSMDLKTFKKEDTDRDFTYETDITDTKEVGRLIALGVENVKGPWLCLICGTPGKALNFCSYHKFRNHLVEVHNERPPSNMCEFCGLKSGKRNHLLHHIYTKHGVPPPPSYNFPKCNQCSYIALTQAFLIKHKMTHTDVRSFHCNVCQVSFKTSNQLLYHIQQTGHKICPDRKANLQCIYCMKVFLRESNLYAHLKTAHKSLARDDGIIDNSDEDEVPRHQPMVKMEPDMRDEHEAPAARTDDDDDDDDDDGQYQIQQQSDGKIQIINKKVIISPNQKILNKTLSRSSSFAKQSVKPDSPNQLRKLPSMKNFQDIEPTDLNEEYNERVIVLNQNEYILKSNETIAEEPCMTQNEEYVLSDTIHPGMEESSESVNMSEVSPSCDNQPQKSNLINKKPSTINQPYQIVVSNEAEYKALIAANPSIIFEGRLQNKELSPLEHDPDIATTTIDLDPSQNNDMMIIQDSYPMDVSEAMNTSNQNIVVVYSQPMGTEGKHFVQYSQEDIIAENVEGQIIQPAEKLTSLTSSAPIMVVQQSVNPWQNEQAHPADTALVESDSNVVSHVTVQAQSQSMQSHVQISSPTVVDKGLTELAELQILSQPESNVITEAVLPEQSEIDQQDIQDSNIVNASEIAINPENIEEQEEIVHQELPETPNVQNQMENMVPQEQSFTEMEVDNVGMEETEPAPSKEVITTLEEEEVGVIINHNDVETNAESESSQEVIENVCKNDVENNILREVDERIKNLAAEWSDEDSAPKILEDNVALSVNDNIETDTSLLTAEIQENIEVEESIENIQQEMENQVTTAVGTTKSRIIITSDITLQNPSETVNSAEKVITQTTEAKVVEDVNVSTKENISSLLNDWDDNDNSQSESIEAKTPDNVVPETLEGMEHKESEPVEDIIPLKEDKLKSLDKIMSDWDEEDDKEE